MNPFENFTVREITGVYTPTYPEPERIKMINRQWYGLSIAIDGELSYTLNGKTTVSDKGHIILLPKGVSYDLNCYKAGRFTLINFLCDEGFEVNEFLKIPVSPEEAESFINMHKNMEKLYLFRAPGSHTELMSMLYDMVSRIQQLRSKEGLYSALRIAIEYMEENIDDPNLSNGAIANTAGVSEIYFRKLFKGRFGLTPHSYMINIRINKAKNMLENGAVAMDEIASSCGFNNIYYFLRVFKQKTGYTPTEYKEKYYRKIL